jgi:hypothetical protein
LFFLGSGLFLLPVTILRVTPNEIGIARFPFGFLSPKRKKDLFLCCHVAQLEVFFVSHGAQFIRDVAAGESRLSSARQHRRRVSAKIQTEQRRL